DLLRGIGPQVKAGRHRRFRLEPDPALLAGAVAAAGGVDRDAVPARRVEEGDSLRDPYPAGDEPGGDALVHGWTGIAWVGSAAFAARNAAIQAAPQSSRPSNRSAA